MPTTSNSADSWDDDPWDAFLADDDYDPEPERGDFWPDDAEELPFTDELIGAPSTTRLRWRDLPCYP